MIRIFTDGSCRANKNGGIGVLWLKDGKKVLDYSKGFKNVTNNIMELMAVYVALRSIKKEIDSLEIISDSEYTIGVLTKNWHPKKNVNLIKKIKQQLESTQKLVQTPIKFIHTRGHQKDNSEYTKWNNFVDSLAQNASQNGT